MGTVSDTNCVFTPFVDPNLNDFKALAKRNVEESQQSPERAKISDSSEESQ